ncbi:hypothetical protein V1517DRAFT_329092 [Lipomyces orientalis]|uniref:Uncharacterized protein n=1 Tax=Lipomyces orientalis TaxID=1233043 RepID=A0ACC3THG3_9ASCO
MKFLTLATLAALASGALAVTKNVTLKVKSDDATIDGMGLSSIHEGAAINYVFLGIGSEDLVYETTNSTIYDPAIIPQFPFYLQIWGNVIAVAVGLTDDVSQFRVDSNSYLTVNGSENVFYAAKNTNDPYNYSSAQYQAVYYADKSDAPEGSIPFTIFVDSSESSTTSVVATTTATSAMPSITSALYVNASITSMNSSATATAPAEFTGAAALNQVSGVLLAGALGLAMLL